MRLERARPSALLSVGWIALICLGLGAGCAHPSPKPNVTLEDLERPDPSRPVGLDELALRLRLIRDPVSLGGGDVRGLVGMDAWDIRKRLGKPDANEWKAASIFPAVWRYRFFREGGTGDVLVIHLDAKHVCTGASWLLVD